MSATTTVEWTRGDDGTPGASWNPVTGCTEVSEGCNNCYAKIFAERWRGVPGHPFEQGFDVRLWPERLALPLRWRKPKRVFVNSMSDLWHEAVPDEFIAAVWTTMFWTSPQGRPGWWVGAGRYRGRASNKPTHTFQILTKRPGRMRSWIRRWGDRDQRVAWIETAASRGWCNQEDVTAAPWMPAVLSNAWLGVSVETQHWAQVRLPLLAQTPAAVRFASCEPLLGMLDIRPWLHGGLDWVITGGESGPKATPMHPDWARSLRDQCHDARVPFFFKQWGEYLPVPIVDDATMAFGRAFDNPRSGAWSAPVIRDRPRAHPRPMRPGDRNGWGLMLDEDTMAIRLGKGRAGRLLDGRTWDEFPIAPISPRR
jgi:protein gp37